MDLTRETKRSVVEFLEKVEQWEMAAANLHDHVFLDSKERHERAPHCVAVYDDSLVRSFASARGIELSGMPRMDEMEELSTLALCGNLAGAAFQRNWLSQHCRGSTDARAHGALFSQQLLDLTHRWWTERADTDIEINESKPSQPQSTFISSCIPSGIQIR